MEILAYRDLESKKGLLPLMEQAFGWPLNPREFEKTIKTDPRLQNSAVAFCANIDKQIVGCVGVLDLATRTSDGSTEYAGGVYGVATLPGHTRKGISTTLFTKVHEYFIEKGYRFSFLNTSPTLVAYALYKKLGYTDVTSYPSAYKIIENRRLKPSSTDDVARFDFDKILKIYDEYTRDKTGLVVRDKKYLKALVKIEALAARQCMLGEKGYVLLKKEKSLVRIRELISLNKKETSRLIGLAEDKARGIVLCRAILDKDMLQAYRSQGFTVMEKGHGVLMVKPLATDASFSQTYGGRFYLSSLDHF